MNTNPERTPVDAGYEKGLACEQLALRASLLMVKHGENIKELKVPPLIGARLTKRYSREDQQGVDLVLILKDGCEIPAGVASSERGKRKHDRHSRIRWAKGLFVTLRECLLIQATDRISKVIGILCDYLNRTYRQVRRAVNWRIHLDRCRREKAERKERAAQKQKERCVRFFAPSMCH